jgi:hypothetical protein
MCGCDTDTANFILLSIGYPATLAFVILYGTLQPWYRSAWGRALFINNVGLSALIGINLFYRAFGWSILARDGWLRVSVYGFITIGIYLTVIALIVTLVRARRERNSR